MSSPNFFSARVGGGALPLLRTDGPQKLGPRAEGARQTKSFATNFAGAEGAGEKLALFSSGK